MPKFLIIQTAFIGDVILATPVIEKIRKFYPEAKIDFLLREGNEGLLHNHPCLRNIYIWDKKKSKYKNLFKILLKVRKERYDYIINAQRFLSTGLFTIFSKGIITVGFDKNPLSLFFSIRAKHLMGGDKNYVHEVLRNISLISTITNNQFVRPALYPSIKDYETVHQAGKYICIAPASVWFTKQLPAIKWIEFINQVDKKYNIILIGGEKDFDICESIKNKANREIINFSGKFNFLQSAALMARAQMNFVNDSAPMHIASAMNAPTTAIFCSTIPQFGFGPLSENSKIVETKEVLSCRPCGIHGFNSCPKGHFKCADINVEDLVTALL